MDYHNRKEGIRECMLDVEEGADIIMIKPALAYLDVIREVAERIPVPVAYISYFAKELAAYIREGRIG